MMTLDIFDILEALWSGKWILASFLAVALAVGTLISSYYYKNWPTPHFFISVPYKPNLYSSMDSQICNRDPICMDKRIALQLNKLSAEIGVLMMICVMSGLFLAVIWQSSKNLVNLKILSV